MSAFRLCSLIAPQKRAFRASLQIAPHDPTRRFNPLDAKDLRDRYRTITRGRQLGYTVRPLLWICFAEKFRLGAWCDFERTSQEFIDSFNRPIPPKHRES